MSTLLRNIKRAIEIFGKVRWNQHALERVNCCMLRLRKQTSSVQAKASLPEKATPTASSRASSKPDAKLGMSTLGTPLLSEQTPEELAVRAQQGGANAVACFGELVTRFHTRLFNFLLRRTRSRSDAEELTQEAFTRAWERLHSYDPSWKFSTWLYTIAARLAVSKHRKLHREVVVESFDRAGGIDLDRLAQHEDRRAGLMLWTVAEQELSRDQYTALWLRYVEDMSIGEIARVLGKAEVGVRVSLFRARAALAKRAQREGWLPLIDIRTDISAAARGAIDDADLPAGVREGVE